MFVIYLLIIGKILAMRYKVYTSEARVRKSDKMLVSRVAQKVQIRLQNKSCCYILFRSLISQNPTFLSSFFHRTVKL